MLLPEKKAPISEYSSLYDLIVPKNSLLRKINEMIDFSFIYEGLSNKYCHHNGRNAESPIRMFKYDLLNLLIQKTVSIAIEKGIIRSKSIIVDATHTLKMAFKWMPLLRTKPIQERKTLP